MSATINYAEDRGNLFYVLSDGKLRQNVPEGTDGAIKRDYEASSGAKGTKYELIANSISGIITNLSIFDGEYGKNVLIIFGAENKKDEIIISFSCQSSFGEDFMKKLPNIDISKEVTLMPFSFENEKGKMIKGVSVKQNGEKIFSHYHKEDKKTGKFSPTNGYPELEAKTKLDKYDNDDWKMYFTKARKFLIKKLEEHPLFIADIKTKKDGTEEKSLDDF